MRRASSLGLICVGVAACGGWPDLEPVDGSDELDPRLGVELARTSGGLRITGSFQEGEVVVLYEDSREGWAARSIDPVSLAIEPMPVPALEPGDTFDWGRALGSLRAIGVPSHLGIPRLAVLADGAAEWVEITMPAALAGQVFTVQQVLTHDARIYLTALDRAFVFADGQWNEPLTSAYPIILGGFDAEIQWLVTRNEASQPRLVPIDADGTLGTEVIGTTVGTPVASAINGNADQFQIVAGGTIYLYAAGTLTATAAAPGAPWSAPGSSTILVSAADGLGGWTFVDAGVVGAEALPAFPSYLSCPVCPSGMCPCAEHALALLQFRPSPAADQLAMVIGDQVNGYAVASVRILDLPFASDPFAAL